MGDIALIREANRRIVRSFGLLSTTLAGAGLAPSAVHAIVEIGFHPGMTATQLSDLLMLEKSSVSRLLRGLIAKGLVTQAAHPTDKRTKHLSLTAEGRGAFEAINRHADDQIHAALAGLTPDDRGDLVRVLGRYAAVLSETRGAAARSPVAVMRGYRPGAVGRIAALHATYYSRVLGFGAAFEAKVAAELADFCTRLDREANALWTVDLAGEILGSIAIDGECLGPGRAQLRWFVLHDRLQGEGLGRRLIGAALAFCDRRGVADIHLTTVAGLDAARHLYEAHGFTLADERPGGTWGKPMTEQLFVRRRTAL